MIETKKQVECDSWLYSNYDFIPGDNIKSGKFKIVVYRSWLDAWGNSFSFQHHDEESFYNISELKKHLDEYYEDWKDCEKIYKVQNDKTSDVIGFKLEPEEIYLDRSEEGKVVQVLFIMFYNEHAIMECMTIDEDEKEINMIVDEN